MRKRVVGAAVLALALSWCAGQAVADVKVRFELTNEDTKAAGKHISASPGDRLVLKLFVQNLERATAEIITDLEAAIPGCIVNAQDVDTYKQKRNKRFKRIEFVPGNLPSGTVLTLRADVVSSLGNTGSDDASVTLVNSKASANAGHVGILQRIFLQAMTRAILASDETGVATQLDFSNFKSLFR